MRNIKLIVAYDGSGYAGFQRQPKEPTIQEELEKCLWRLTGEKQHITGAGRTDAGVHALGQVVNFRTESAIPVERFAPAFNSLLPEDIAVLRAGIAPDDFHARLRAKRKTYEYRIWRETVRSVFERGRVYHFTRPLALDDMKKAASLLIGRHDFACFSSAGSSAATSVRTIYEAGWEERGSILSFTVSADGFLYKMVRTIVGTLVEVGLGKHPPDWTAELIASGDRGSAGPTVPGAGLFLVRVDY